MADAQHEKDNQKDAKAWDADGPTTPFFQPPPPDSAAEAGSPGDKTGLKPLLQRYEILGELGRGGMGIVYKARDRETGDVVALKLLLPEIASRADLVERFKSELVLARKVTDPNVCRVHEFLRFENTAAISMEYVEGENLRDILRRYGPLSVRRGLEWARQICAAVSAAHVHGVVHRDLKPENILVQLDGTVKVMDFGIARSVETGTTKVGALIGTPAYMSPEQAEGKPADARSDIYSLGLILYEMFTGQPAFRAETPVALLAKRVTETPPPPSSVEPYLPEFLADAIQKCLAKEPDKRFQSVGELEAGVTGRAPVPPVVVRGRRRAVWLAGAGIGAALVFIAGFFVLRGPPARGMRHNSEVTCIAFSPDGRLLASASLDKLIKLWDVATQREIGTLRGHTRAVSYVAFSPDGHLLVSGGADRFLRLWNLTVQGEEHILKGHTRSVDSVAFSPDGRWIASGGDDGTVRIWETATAREVRTLKGHTSEVTAVAFGADSHLLASGSEDETVRLWDPATGRGIRVLSGHGDAVQNVALSRDGRWLASASLDGTVRIWEVATGNVFQTLDVEKNGVRDSAFSPDGRWIATGDEEDMVRVWEVETGKELQKFAGHSGTVLSVAFAPDGKLLASGSSDGSIRFWRLNQQQK